MEAREDEHVKDVRRNTSRIGRACEELSQTVSRRSMISRLGRLGLGVLGVGVAQQVVPVFQHVAKATHTPCHYWYFCQFEGRKCACAGCSGDVNECPSCSRVGGSWTGCCTNSFGNRQLVTYTDCYKDNCSWAKVDACRNGCTWCDHVPENKETYYDGTSTYYMCTRVRIGGSCSGHPAT